VKYKDPLSKWKVQCLHDYAVTFGSVWSISVSS